MKTTNKFCHNCGIKLIPTAKFCGECGTSQSSLSAKPPEAEPVVEKKKKTMFGHFISANVRDAFMRWKKKALFAQTVIEVNEIGPVVEEVLE